LVHVANGSHSTAFSVFLPTIITHGGRGDDFRGGGAEDDLLRGEAGDGFMFGGQGDGVLFGGDGDGLMTGGVNRVHSRPGLSERQQQGDVGVWRPRVSWITTA
jgi:hypothetical protein